MNKFISFFAIVCGSTLAISAQGISFQIDGVYYETNAAADDEVWVAVPSESGQSEYQYPLDADGCLIIPATVRYESVTYKVTGVASDAIVGQTAMQSLILPKTIVDLHNSIHDCPALKYLDLGGASRISAIGYHIGLPALEELRIESEEEVSFGSGVFYELQSLRILRLPRRFVGADRVGDDELPALFDCFCYVPLLSEVYSPSVIPPLVTYLAYVFDCPDFPRNGAHFIGEESVDANQYKVYIPVGTYDAYSTHPSWEACENLIETDMSGVLPAAMDYNHDESEQIEELYTLTGVKISSTNPFPGVYICRSNNGTSRKIVIR